MPEVFTVDDVVKCFGYKNDNTTYSKIKRLLDDGRVVIHEEYVEDGHTKKKYRKLCRMCV